MGTGIFLGALAGAGAGLDKYATDRQRLDDERTLMEERSKMEIERQNTIERNRAKIQAEPLDRFGKYLQSAIEKNVPIPAEDVTSLGQESATESGLSSGMQGKVSGDADIRNRFIEILKSQNATPEQKESAQAILDQINTQMKSQGMINQRAVEGKTRAPSYDEAFESAYRQAMVSDPSAALAVHPMRRDERAEKKLISDIEYQKIKNERMEKKQDVLQAYQMAKEDRLMELQENNARYQQSLMESNSQKEQQSALQGMRNATSLAMNNAEKELFNLKKDLADPLLDPKKKEVLESMRSDLQSEVKRYRAALSGTGVALPEVEAKPAPFPIGTIKNGFKYLGGDTTSESNWEKVDGSTSQSKPPTESAAETSSSRQVSSASERQSDIDKFNKLIAGSSPSNASRRESNVDADFALNLDMLKSRNFKDAKSASAWFNENSDRLTSEQISAFRSAKKSQGLL